MPFKSPEQRKYLYSQKPEVAKKFAKHEKPDALDRAMRKTKSSGNKKGY